MKMTKARKIALGLSLAATTLAGAAYAADAMKGDGVTTRAEAETHAQQMFARMDANKDGKLDQADRTAREKARFDRVDANHDGSVSYAEFTAMHTQHDGAGKERFAQRGEHADRAGRAGQHRMAFRDASRGRGGMTRLADADKDGAITRDEFRAAALARFDRLDADKDGTVTREEAKAARDSMRQRWQARHEAQRAG